MSWSDNYTARTLAEIEKRIQQEYEKASAELNYKASQYFNQFEKRYLEEYDKYQQGEYTKQEFDAWVTAQVARGRKFEQMRNQAAERISKSNKVASEYINGKLADVFVNNANYEQYLFNHDYGDVRTPSAFTIYNENAVRRLIVKDPKNLPFATTRIESEKDQLYYQRRLQSALIQGIIQGDGIDRLSRRFIEVVGGAMAAAVRNARTAVTGAQNAGRMESFTYCSEELGLEVQKMWVATLDERTRESHQELDGETVDFDEEFSNKLRYPGDPDGEPSEVWNCRCAMCRKRKNSKSPYTTYKQWLDGQKVEGRYAREYSTIEKDGKKVQVDTLELARERNGWQK